MQQDDYEYRGLIAESWDLLRGDTSKWEDRFFYKKIIERSGQPALDVGCGTGRLLLDYLSQGIDMEGVDVSPEMLDLCSRKAEEQGLRPALYLQNMEALDLPRKYRTILVPSSSFQLVTDREEARETMRRFFGHLEPGGTLVMPFMVLWTGEALEPVVEEWRLVGEKVRREDGLTVRRWVRATYDVLERLEHTEDRYELLRDGEVITTAYYSRSPATRWYTQEEAVQLYEEAGFGAILALKGFTFEPATPSDTIFTVVGTRL